VSQWKDAGAVGWKLEPSTFTKPLGTTGTKPSCTTGTDTQPAFSSATLVITQAQEKQREKQK